MTLDATLQNLPDTEDGMAAAFAGLIDDDLGITEEAAAPAASPDDPPPETPEADDSPDTNEAPEQEETDEPADPEDGAEETEDDPQPSAVEIETVADLAKQLEMSTDDLLKLRIQGKAAGEDYDLPLSEILEGFSHTKDANKKRQEVAEQRKQLEQQEQARAEATEQYHAHLAARFGAVDQMFEAQLREIAPLEHTDAALYLQELRRINGQRDEFRNMAAKSAQEYAERQQEALHTRRVQSMRALREAIPDWDVAHAQTVAAAMRDYDISDDEIKNTDDPRAIRAFHDLAKLRAENAELKAAAEKANATAAKATAKVKKTVPKMAKVEQPMSAGVKLKLARAKALKRLQKTGDPADAVALFADAIDME